MRSSTGEDARAETDWRAWRDRLRTLDPDGSSLRRATRAALAAMIASLLLFHGIRWFHQPKSVAFIGIYVAVLGAVLVNDSTRAERRVTMLFLPVAAAISLALGSAVAPVWWLNNLVFVLVIFASVFIRQFGPRYLALGFVGFLAYFISIFFQARLADVPWLLAGVAVGGAIAYALRFWIWPEHPEKEWRRNLAAYRAQLRRICRALACAIHRGEWPGQQSRRFRGLIAQLNDLALSLEGPIAADSAPNESRTPPSRQWILDLELAMESMVEASRRLLQSGHLSPQLCETLGVALQQARAALEKPGMTRGDLLALSDEIEAASANSDAAGDVVPLKHFAHALADFARALARSEQPGAAEPPSAAAIETPASSDDSSDEGYKYRQAIQASVAGAVAIAAGELISPQRWYWAVIAAFVVFSQTETSSETLVKAWQRILGTLIGIGVGLAAGELVLGHRDWQLALIYVCIFFAYLFLRISYAWMIFWFTLLLSVLYSFLGLLTPGLLGLRLLLTAAGAAVGVLSARFLLPSRTGQKVRNAGLAVLRAAADLLRRAALGEYPGTDRVREVDRKLQEMRTAADPLRRRYLPVEGRDQVDLAHCIDVIGFSARQLTGLWPTAENDGAAFSRIANNLAENTTAILQALEERCPPQIESVRSQIDRAADAIDDSRQSRLYHWLARIDRALLDIARQSRS